MAVEERQAEPIKEPVAPGFRIGLVVILGIVVLGSVGVATLGALQHDTSTVGRSYPVVCPSVYDRVKSQVTGSSLPVLHDTTGHIFAGSLKTAHGDCSALSDVDNSDLVIPWLLTGLGALVLAIIVYPWRLHMF